MRSSCRLSVLAVALLLAGHAALCVDTLQRMSVAVSANLVHGFPLRLFDEEGNSWRAADYACACFRRFDPIARRGYSICGYEVTSTDADRGRRRMELEPSNEEPRGESR